MRKVIAALALTGGLAACNPSAPSAPADTAAFPTLNATAYRSEANIITEDGTVMPLVMVRDGARGRIEMTGPQGRTIIITNADTDENFVISSAGGRTMAMRTSNAGFDDPAAAWSAELAATATATGPCTVAGEIGTQWSREEDGQPTTVCVTGDGIVLQATQAGRTTWETTRVQRGSQPADQFVVPAGVQVVDLGNMGQQMQDAIDRAKAQAGQ